MSATCVPWYVPRGNTGLSTHDDPVFPHFCPWDQSLVRVKEGGGGTMGPCTYQFRLSDTGVRQRHNNVDGCQGVKCSARCVVTDTGPHSSGDCRPPVRSAGNTVEYAKGGARRNYCLPIRSTTQILTQSKNSDNELRLASAGLF